MTLQDKLLALCLREVACPTCGGTNIHPQDKEPRIALADQFRGDCPKCWYGKVYLLDPGGKFGLRVKCPNDRETRNAHAMVGMLAETPEEEAELPSCCQGRGWIPTTDLWAYVKAAWPYGFSSESRILRLRITNAIVGALNNHLDPGQAAFDVVWKAMMVKERKS